MRTAKKAGQTREGTAQMQPQMTKQEVSQASEALVHWFLSQEITRANAAIIMTHLLGVITGECARNADDLATGVGYINDSLNNTAAKAFCTKYGIDHNKL